MINKRSKGIEYCFLVIFMCLLTACNFPNASQFFGKEAIDSKSIEDPSSPEDSILESINPGTTPRAAIPEDKNDYALPSPSPDLDCSFFVARDGDDNNPGNMAEPWASFQMAAEMANPGDTICFRGGSYTTEDVHLTKSGRADEPIIFAAYPGEIPFLDGAGTANELITLKGGVSYLRLSGFVLRNFRIWGIFLSGENRHIILDHLEVEGGEASIRFTYGDSTDSPPAEGPVEYVLLEDSVFHGSKYSAVDCSPGPCNHIKISHLEIFNTGLSGESFYGSDGLAVDRGHHIFVEDCYVHDNGGDGIDLGSRDREGHMEGIIVRRNHVVRNRLNGIKVWAGGRIENNVIWGQGNSAIWAGTWNSTIEIINNTVAYNMWDPRYAERNWAVVVGYPEELPRPQINLTMMNNIFAFNADPLNGGPTGVYIGPGVQLNEGHNIYFSKPDGEITVDKGSGHEMWVTRQEIANGNWASISGGGAGNLVSDPMFFSGWPDVDLRLGPNSPGVNGGNSEIAPEEDVLGGLRDDEPDIGAHENEHAIGYKPNAALTRVVGIQITVPRVHQSSYFPDALE